MWGGNNEGNNGGRWQRGASKCVMGSKLIYKYNLIAESRIVTGNPDKKYKDQSM